MRVVTWNMNHWQRTPAERDRGWKFLEKLKPDIALVQEANPAGRYSPDQIVFREQGIDKIRHWGSAVISFNKPLTEVTNVGSFELCRTIPGSLAIAKMGEMIFISQYGAWERGYVTPNVHRQLSDLTPLLDDSKIRVVLGGDLNMSTQFGGRQGLWHRNALDRYATLGLVDCLLLNRPARESVKNCCKSPCLHVHTHINSKRGKNKKPWQNDYIFVSEGLERSVQTCAPSNHVSRWKFSDHCPVILELDI